MTVARCREIVNEGTSKFLETSFFNDDGDPATPETLSYIIHDRTNDVEIRPETSLSPASVVNIELMDNDVAIYDQANDFENRAVTVKTTFAAGRTMNDVFDYTVKNLVSV